MNLRYRLNRVNHRLVFHIIFRFRPFYWSMYAYQIFGIILRDDIELIKLISGNNERFQNLPGLIQRLVFSHVEDQVASGIFICKDKETAERVRSIIHEIEETFNEYYYILNEFIFRIIESTIYESKYSELDTSQTTIIETISI